MKIAVTEIGRTFGRQTHAYAEYRMFSSLARFSALVRDVRVSLVPSAVGRRSVVCRVSVSAERGVRIRVAGRGRHPYDAINRAAEQLRDALRRHGDAAMS